MIIIVITIIIIIIIVISKIIKIKNCSYKLCIKNLCLFFLLFRSSFFIFSFFLFFFPSFVLPPRDRPPPDRPPPEPPCLRRTTENFALYFPLPPQCSFFLPLSGVFSWFFGDVLKRQGPHMCTFEGPGLQNTTKIPREDSQER